MTAEAAITVKLTLAEADAITQTIALHYRDEYAQAQKDGTPFAGLSKPAQAALVAFTIITDAKHDVAMSALGGLMRSLMPEDAQDDDDCEAGLAAMRDEHRPDVAELMANLEQSIATARARRDAKAPRTVLDLPIAAWALGDEHANDEPAF
jgi:hypothetical protein